MKVSEITTTLLANHLKLDSPDATTLAELAVLLSVAKTFIKSYTGIKDTDIMGEDVGLDAYGDFVIVVYVLVLDMYDNRSLYVDSDKLNKVVETILNMHSTNLL